MIVRTAAVGVIQSALAAVEAERQFINDLNVYPVPDGDTGTNMALTVRAVVEELEQSDVTDIPSVAAAVTKGSLMGARGNSGVILSQIVRGICDVWGQANSLDTAVFKQAVVEGQHAAYRAVKTPGRGHHAHRHPRDGDGGAGGARRPRAGAPARGGGGGRQDRGREHDRAAAGPPEGRRRRRRRLRPARAVPRPRRGHRGPHARRQGRRRRARSRRARPSDGLRRGGPAGPARTPSPSRSPSELSEFRYCTSFLITGEGIDREAFEAFLLPIGDSALVVGDERTVKVHVHVNDPGVVLSEALKHGSIGDIEINDMHAQTRERDERLCDARGA